MGNLYHFDLGHTNLPGKDTEGFLEGRLASGVSGLVTWLLDEKLDKSAQGLKQDVIIWRLKRKIPIL